MIRVNFLIYIIFSVIIFSCKSEDKNIVAEYKDYSLTKTELRELIPVDISKEDSINLANEYIERWLKEKILLEKSNDIFNEDNKLEIETKVEDYKNDLIISSLEEQWLAESPPKEPTEKEIEEFYNENTDIIPVKNTVLEYIFINAPKKEIGKIRNLLRKNNLDSIKKIVSKKNYLAQVEKDKWIKWSDLLKVLSLSSHTPERLYLRKNKTFEITKGNNIILLKVIDYAQQGQSAPLSYAKKTLKNILLNKRKLNLLSKKKEELYQKAIYNNEIKRK